MCVCVTLLKGEVCERLLIVGWWILQNWRCLNRSWMPTCQGGFRCHFLLWQRPEVDYFCTPPLQVSMILYSINDRDLDGGSCCVPWGEESCMDVHSSWQVFLSFCGHLNTQGWRIQQRFWKYVFWVLLPAFVPQNPNAALKLQVNTPLFEEPDNIIIY